jgi:hypothetical protein
MSGIIKSFKSFVYKCDFFSTSEFLRYNHEESYRTLTGGTCSIMIVIIFSIIFANLGIQTVNKSIISSSSTTVKVPDPTLV